MSSRLARSSKQVLGEPRLHKKNLSQVNPTPFFFAQPNAAFYIVLGLELRFLCLHSKHDGPSLTTAPH